MLASSLLALLRRLRSRRGAVALEAILSILLMFGAFQVMWGAALVIFNQSKVLTGTQFAAQGAVVVYDRSTYRGCSGGTCFHAGAKAKAQAAAQSLLAENAGIGLARDQYNESTATVTMSAFDVSCSPAVSLAAAGMEGNCIGTPEQAAVTRVEVQAQATQTYWLLAPLANATRERQSSDQRSAALGRTCGAGRCTRAVSLSVSEAATP